MRQRIRGFFGIFLCVAVIMASAAAGPLQVRAQEELQLYATAAVLMDADSGRVLYAKNAQDPMAMASTTKIMTCIVVLEQGNPEDLLTVSSYAASMPKVRMNLQKGETYRVKDLLLSLMLESHNDSAVALAEYIGKRLLDEELSVKDTAEYTAEESRQAVAAFAGLMNQKAGELGCRNTYFITPNGLDATETITLDNGETLQRQHETTAAELARIMAYCIRESPMSGQFLEITRTASHSFTANGRSFSCNNHNAFLSMMEGALSGKTGFTNKAGYCYVGALEREGKTFVVALLACGWPNHKTYKWSDARELMEYGLEHYEYRSFLEQGTAFPEEQLEPVLVEGGQTQVLGGNARVQLAIEGRGEDAPGSMDSEAGTEAEDAGEGIDGLLMREEEQVEVKYKLPSSLQAPVRNGTRIGTIYYIVDDTIYRTEHVITTQDIGKIDIWWCFRQIWKRFSFFL